MQRVKNYLVAYKKYAKEQADNLETMKKSNTYSDEYLSDKKKAVEYDLDIKRAEYLKGINEVIDGKLKSIVKPNRETAEYQAIVSNALTKVQMMGPSINKKILNEILEPIIEKQDVSAIAAVKSYIEGLPNFPGGSMVKNELLASVPRVVDQSEIIENARNMINNNVADLFGSDLKSTISIELMDSSGVFEL